MKRRVIFGLASMVILLVPLGARGQSGADLFQRGLQKERVEGDLKGAITIYQRVVRENAANRVLAAKALVQLGSAYETLGKADAKSVYERVLRDYGEQSEQVAIARARLAALTSNATIGDRSEPTVRRVWAGKGADGFGAPTRDGHSLTFVDWETGDLAVRDLTAGQNRRLTNKGGWEKSAAFALFSRPSRDGRKVAYTWFNPGAQPELRVVGIDGGESRVLYANPDVEYVQPFDWSPDGTQILVSLYDLKSKISQIALVSSTDGTVRVLKSLDWRGPDRMSFSPDGRYIVYDARSGSGVSEERDVFIIASDGSSESPLVRHTAHDIALGWTTDGKYVLFGSDRTGNMSMWVAPVSSGKAAGEPVLVRRDAEFSLTPMGFTQSGIFYYTTEPSPVDIYVASLDPRTGRVVGVPTRVVDRYVGANRQASWSRDGKTIAYLSQRRPGVPGRAGRQLIVRSLETGAERVVPSQVVDVSTPRWSPDDQYLLVNGRDEKGTQGIFRVDPESGAATLLVPTGNGPTAGWSADKQSIIYVSQDFLTRRFAIIRHNLQTGESRDLVRLSGRVNIWQAAVSPDGQQVAFSIVDSVTTSVRVVSENGGEVRDLCRLPNDYALECSGSIAWSADGRYIFLSQDRKNEVPRMSLVRLPVAGGPPQETGVVMDQIQSLRPHPDGRRIAFTAGRQDVEVWTMENFVPKAGGVKK